MPRFSLPINGVYYSVDRPVILSVVRQVMDQLQISTYTRLLFKGDEAVSQQQGSNIEAPTLVEGGHNFWPHDQKLEIEVDSDYEKSRLLNMAVKDAEHGFIFADRALGFFLKPVYSTESVKITFKYKTVDKEEARRFRDRIRVRLAESMELFLHTCSYSYLIPSVFLELVGEIHAKREMQGGYGDSLEDYYLNHLSERASLLTNLAGGQKVWAISEKQNRIQGRFMWGDMLERPSKEGEGDSRDYTFNYEFNFDKPIECVVTYPVMVHNTFLDEIYRPVQKDYRVEDQFRRMSLSTLAMDRFESDRYNLDVRGIWGIRIPYYDDFTPNVIRSSTLTVFTALLTISEKDKKTLFNLSELGEHNLDGDILDFMRQTEYSFINDDYASVFCLNLYENSKILPSKRIVIDKDLNVSSVVDLDVRNTYHVRFSLVCDPSYLSTGTIKRLQQSKVRDKFTYFLNQHLYGNVMRKDVNKNYLSPGYNPAQSNVITRPNAAQVIPAPSQPLKMPGSNAKGPSYYSKSPGHSVDPYPTAADAEEDIFKGKLPANYARSTHMYWLETFFITASHK
jgi:hypothetical protein